MSVLGKAKAGGYFWHLMLAVVLLSIPIVLFAAIFAGQITLATANEKIIGVAGALYVCILGGVLGPLFLRVVKQADDSREVAAAYDMLRARLDAIATARQTLKNYMESPWDSPSSADFDAQREWLVNKAPSTKLSPAIHIQVERLAAAIKAFRAVKYSKLIGEDLLPEKQRQVRRAQVLAAAKVELKEFDNRFATLKATVADVAG